MEIEDCEYSVGTTPVSIRFPLDQIEKLKRISRKLAYEKDQDITHTDLIRECVDSFLENKTKKYVYFTPISHTSIKDNFYYDARLTFKTEFSNKDMYIHSLGNVKIVDESKVNAKLMPQNKIILETHHKCYRSDYIVVFDAEKHPNEGTNYRIALNTVTSENGNFVVNDSNKRIVTNFNNFSDFEKAFKVSICDKIPFGSPENSFCYTYQGLDHKWNYLSVYIVDSTMHPY